VCVLEDPDIIINTMNMLWAKDQGIVVQCPAGARGFFFPKMFKWAVELNHPPTEWVLGAFIQRVK
jgi:hypothetical protein